MCNTAQPGPMYRAIDRGGGQLGKFALGPIFLGASVGAPAASSRDRNTLIEQSFSHHNQENIRWITIYWDKLLKLFSHLLLKV